VRKNTLSKAEIFLQMLGFVPVRRQVMENALRMSQTAVYEYFCGTSPYHGHKKACIPHFKINREFYERSHKQIYVLTSFIHWKYLSIYLILFKSSKNSRTLYGRWILENP